MQEDESLEGIKNIFCPNCFKQSEFIDGKCDFCGVNLTSKYTKMIGGMFSFSVMFLVLGIFYQIIEFLSFLSIIFFIISFFLFIMIFPIIKGSIIDKKISEKNTILKRKQRLKEIELEKIKEEQKREQEKLEKLELDEDRKKQKQYEIFRKEMEEKCIEYIIQNPSLLLLFKNILDNANDGFKYISTKRNGKLNSEEKLFFTKENFIILFFDFLLGCTKCEEMTPYEDETYYELHIYKSKLLLEKQDKIGNGGGERYKKGIILYEGDSEHFNNVRYYLSRTKTYLHWDSIQTYLACIFRYSRIMKIQMEFYQNTLKRFEENEELLQIYNNLKKGKCDKEYINEKIYSLYETLYADGIDKKFSRAEIEWIIDLKEKDEIPEKITGIKNTIKTREQIVDLLINELNYLNQNEIVLWMVESLRKQKDINVENKIDIIQNINEIIDEVMIKREEKEKIENAKSERDRLLKGDLSKEKEYEELSLSMDKIKDGFEFEKYVAKLYEKLGYTLEKVTKKSGDQGADVIVSKDNIRYVIQAKFYNNHVGNKAIQEVVAAMPLYKADKGIVITNNVFTSSAKELAKANGIKLVDGKKIEEYKKQIFN